jgi:hypothetical protein
MTELCSELHKENQYIELPPTSIVSHYAFMDLDRLMICCCQTVAKNRQHPSLEFKPCDNAWQGDCLAFKVSS